MTAGVDGLLRDKTRPSRIPALSQMVIDRVVERSKKSRLALQRPLVGALQSTGP